MGTGFHDRQQVVMWLALLLSVTPAECSARPDWCFCRRYLAVELNKCENKTNKLKEEVRIQALRDCTVQYEVGKSECDAKDL